MEGVVLQRVGIVGLFCPKKSEGHPYSQAWVKFPFAPPQGLALGQSEFAMRILIDTGCGTGRFRGPGSGMHSPKSWVGVFRPERTNLTLFQTKMVSSHKVISNTAKIFIGKVNIFFKKSFY